MKPFLIECDEDVSVILDDGSCLSSNYSIFLEEDLLEDKVNDLTIDSENPIVETSEVVILWDHDHNPKLDVVMFEADNGNVLSTLNILIQTLASEFSPCSFVNAPSLLEEWLETLTFIWILSLI